MRHFRVEDHCERWLIRHRMIPLGHVFAEPTLRVPDGPRIEIHLFP
uniref:Uncharacterized protein n=1 Tax=Candidatus Kentrum sp. FW TaxID=2126338 RepID=A0A450U3L8_9GAMM|nr:MAG: hypothetical protein BECKFW1821C_GA0114237_11396 [Candidatus Kentron sp. FW]